VKGGVYRGRKRGCPACRGPMEEIPLATAKNEGVTVEICRPCGGAFLEYDDGEPGAIARALAKSEAGPKATPRLLGGAPVCPDCDLPLVLRHYLDRGPELFRCGGCLAAFATRMQLDELAAWRPTEEPERPPEPPSLWDLIRKLFR
jgi:hypothetical protein